jgi:hypothetical protein
MSEVILHSTAYPDDDRLRSGWGESSPEYFTTAFVHRPEELPSKITAAELLPLEGPAWLAGILRRVGPIHPRRQRLLDLVRAVEREAILLGASSRMLAVVRKRAWEGQMGEVREAWEAGQKAKKLPSLVSCHRELKRPFGQGVLFSFPSFASSAFSISFASFVTSARFNFLPPWLDRALVSARPSIRPQAKR